VFDYIERYYNPTRRHSTLGYVGPMDFKRRAAVAEPSVRETSGSSRWCVKGQADIIAIWGGWTRKRWSRSKV